MKTPTLRSYVRQPWLPFRIDSSNIRLLGSAVRRTAVLFALTVSALFFGVAPCVFGDDSEIVAVYSAVSPAYKRTVLPGGSFKPETITFGEGGATAGEANDPTIDKIRFLDVARLISPSLAKRSFIPEKDPRKIDLLVMVYWGTTIGTNRQTASGLYQTAQQGLNPVIQVAPLNGKKQTPQFGPGGGKVDPATQDPSLASPGERNMMEDANSNALAESLLMVRVANRQRDQQDIENAKVLGYLNEVKRLDEYRNTYFKDFYSKDILEEVEESRYYVVLMAYDFQTLLKTKQRKLMWETRFSIREQRHDFSKALAAMADNASRYFGQDSHGLVRKDLPETRITFGDAKVLEYEPEKHK